MTHFTIANNVQSDLTPEHLFLKKPLTDMQENPQDGKMKVWSRFTIEMHLLAPLPNDKFIDWSQFKAFAYDKINVT